MKGLGVAFVDGLRLRADVPHKASASENRFWTVLKSHALTGAAALALLAILEYIDLNFRISPFFQSFAERLELGAYFSLNVLVGFILGALVGLAAIAGGFLRSRIAALIERTGAPRPINAVASWGIVVILGATVANWHPDVHGYIIAIIRKAEMFHRLNQPLLYHERASSYVVVAIILGFCSLMWMMTTAIANRGPLVRATWLSVLGILILASYYIDTRVQVQLYRYSLHRTLFLADLILSMSFAGSLWAIFGEKLRPALRDRRIRTGAFAAFIVAVLCAATYTFLTFGRDQNLETQLFYQTAVTKQDFKLIQWALDFDRDGYSPFLDGGDKNDFRADINPGHPEVVGDGVDNDCLGGDLTLKEIADWRNESLAARSAVPGPVRKLNVVFIFIDALRADHLGTYGYKRNTSPNIDKLAARSTVFVNGFAPSPRTSESVPKFMQSAYWDARIKSWTQVLKENGYNLFLFPDVRSWVRYEEFFPGAKETKRVLLKKNIDNAIRALSDAPADKPFCAFVYAPDPHRPYVEHSDFYYGSSDTDLYDGEIAYTDFHLGRLFDWLDQSGRMKDTMVVVMADHGESLGERGVYRHATQLYNEQTHVPMIFYDPDEKARRVSTYVSSIDLGTTILNAVGIPAPEDYFGVNLLPLMRGQTIKHPPLYGEQTGEEPSPYVRFDQQINPVTKKYMLITEDGYKLIYNRDYYNFELYDLKSDPHEERNLYDAMPTKAASMRQLLGRFVDIATALRPWNADEGRFSRSGLYEGDKIDQ